MAKMSGRVADSPLRLLLEDGNLFESHLTNLPADGRRSRGQVDPHLAIARAKIEDAENFEELLGYLMPRETLAVLHSSTLLLALQAMPRAT